jgi:hypothetical protein
MGMRSACAHAFGIDQRLLWFGSPIALASSKKNSGSVILLLVDGLPCPSVNGAAELCSRLVCHFRPL